MQNSKPASRVVNDGHLRGVRPNGSEIRPALIPNAFPNSEQVPTSSPSAGTELPPHLQRARSSPVTMMVPTKPSTATKRTRMSPVPSRKASRGEDKTKDAAKTVEADSASQSRLQRNDSTPTRRQFPISDSPMELLEEGTSDEAGLGLDRCLALMKLRVFLVEKMLDALNHNSDGGFGIRLDDVEEEFQTTIDSSDYAFLMEIGNGLEDLIASKCSDLVYLKQLIVGRVGMMGCVPATAFCKAPKKVEAEMKAKLQLIQTKCDSAKQDSYQDSSMSRALISKIKDLLKSTVQEVLSGQRTFLTIEAFEELFAKKYGSKLDPKTAGFDSVLELLKGLKMDDLINLISNDGMMYMVPSNQVFTQHQQDKRIDQSQKNSTVNKIAIQQQKKGKEQSKKDSTVNQALVQQQEKRKSQSPKNSTATRVPPIQQQKKGKEPSRKDSTVNQVPVQQQDKGNNQSRKDSTLNKTLNQQQDNRNDQSRKDSTVNQVPVQQQDVRNDQSRKDSTVNQVPVQQQVVAAAQHSVPPPPPIPEPQSRTTVDNRTGQIPEHRERIEVKLQTQDTAPQFVDLLNEEEPVFRSVDMAEFDEVILNKLRNLFTTVICNGGQTIALYRLPMHFLNHTGSILDYKKYGFIELADVVALLQDIVHVVDTAKGKVIAAVSKQRRWTSQSISTEQGLQRVDPIRSRTSVPTQQLLPFTQMMESVPQLSGIAQPNSPIGGGGGGGILRRDLDAPIQGFFQADGSVAYQQFPVQHIPGALNVPQQELVMNRLPPAQQLFQHSFNGLNNRTQQRPF